MPLYMSVCPECARTHEEFCHVPEERGVQTVICVCGSSMAPVLSVGVGLTWFRENAGRVITNLGPEPLVISSHEQHKAAMRAAGVEWTTPWARQGTGGWV